MLAGAAFLTRAPLAFAIPFYMLMLEARPGETVGAMVGSRFAEIVRGIQWRRAVELGLGVLPAILFFLAYNQVRFGSPFESGYGLATLPPFLEEKRALGMFALAHVPMNLELFLLHLPTSIPRVPVLPAGRAGDVRAAHEPGAAVRASAPTGAGRGRGGCWGPPLPS